MTIPNSLNENVYNSILSLLESAEERNEEELAYMKKIHNAVVDTSSVIRIKDNKSIHYSNRNTELYNKLQELFGDSDLVLDCFYKFKYNVGDYARPHFDSYSEQTSLILLTDNFTGGVFTLDSKELNFNKKGMFVNFDSTQRHSVSEVLTGQRKVLVMLFQNKKRIGVKIK